MAADSSGPSSSKRSLKRSSIVSVDKEESLNWEGHKDYMTIKRRKLRDQVELLGKQESAIFDGVTIYVNGYTDRPDTDQLKEKIHAYGGVYEYRLSSSITHIIATNLPTAKIRNLGHSTIVCRPEWIVDSIKAGTLLPVDRYLLYKPSQKHNMIQFNKPDQGTVCDITSLKVAEKEAGPIVEKGAGPVANDDSVLKTKDFVSEFYSNSRLHYLSTWSKELKDFTSRMLPKARQVIPRLNEASLRGRGTNVIVHVDIDCFFVSVSLLDRPHLLGKPVAVTHAKKTSSPLKQQEHSMSDIASCSYEAREVGIKNGMSVGEALKKCPDLILVPYDFDKYRYVSQTFYEVLISYSHLVEAVSCDEGYIELTDYARDTDDVMEIVRTLREEVKEKTGCTVSAGVSHNMLLARVATRKAKPNGQFLLREEEAMDYLSRQPVGSLPGVGWALNRKLQEYSITTCSDLCLVPMATLKTRHGDKTGEMLYCYGRGIDSRELKLTSETKSLSVDINFGVRFTKTSEAEELLLQLSSELERRGKERGIRGECVSLKVKVRKAGASSTTRKYLGHGPCDNLSRSFNFLSPTGEGAEIGRVVCRLLRQINPAPSDIRGMGIQLTKLVSQTGQARSNRRDIRSMMSRTKVTTNDNSPAPVPDKSPISVPHHESPIPFLQSPVKDTTTTATSSCSLNDSMYNLPPLSELDQSVLLALPPDLQDKILNEYSSKPHKHVEKELNGPSASLSCNIEGASCSTAVEMKHHDFSVVRISNSIQEQYVSDLRSNLRKWVTKSKNGPTETETTSFNNYVSWLAQSNVEIVYLALKCLKRLIVSRKLVKEWASLFNGSLTIVQRTLQTDKHYNTLAISPIV